MHINEKINKKNKYIKYKNTFIINQKETPYMILKQQEKKKTKQNKTPHTSC